MATMVAEWAASSPELDKLFEAKSKALGQMKNAPRTCKSHYGMYADLATIWDTIRKPLAENGLDVIQTFVQGGDDGTILLVTTLGHASGQFIRSYLPIKGTLQPQQLAATATYLKRVELAAIIGVAAEDDDDGEAANRVAVSQAVEEEGRVEQMATKALRAAKTAEKRAEVLARAQQRVDEGTLPPAAVGRLKLIAADMDAKDLVPA
jgi:hypothetical protein